MHDKWYLDIGNAKDELIKSPRDRAIYRFLEMVPGILSWGTLIFVTLMSWIAPVFIAFFIIAFDIYWLLKTVFLSFHLKSTYKKMREYMKVDWLEELNSLICTNTARISRMDQKNNIREISGSSVNIRDYKEIYHLVTLPFYQEPYEVIEKSFEAILNSNYPKDKIIISLSVEEKRGEAGKEILKKIQEKFGAKFFKLVLTVHPKGIAGELPGKGSNTTWAAREAKKEVVDALKIPYENIIVSNLDIDTILYPNYFACLTYHFLSCPDPYHSSFQPVPVFNNNIWQANAFSRVVATSGTFWHMMQQERPERLATFSSHALSFKAFEEVNFLNVKNVSEDSRIFWKLLMFYDGKYATHPIFYPVSMDANLAPTFWQTCVNIYKQQRRWGWGAENIPYVIFGFLKNKKIPLRAKIFWTFNHLEGFWSWGTNALILFMLGWLPLFLGGPGFNLTVLSYNLPQVTRTIMTLAMVGLVSSAIISTLLLPPRPQRYGKNKHLAMIFQWILLPVCILIFGALPGLEAQSRLMFGKYMGFWTTPKTRTDAD